MADGPFDPMSRAEFEEKLMPSMNEVSDRFRVPRLTKAEIDDLYLRYVELIRHPPQG